MKHSDADWVEKRKKGITRYLIFDGILKMGGPFAVVMQVIGYFILREESQTFGDYFSSPRTWTTFFFHATLFGLIMGFIIWRRNEHAIAGKRSGSDDKP
jgi:hypothetical protein